MEGYFFTHNKIVLILQSEKDRDWLQTTCLSALRALAKLLLNYRKVYGLRTVESLISRWAPSNENDTRAYAAAVSRDMGVPPQAGLHLDQGTLSALVTAIIRHENGQQPYSAELIGNAVREVLA